MLKHPHYTKIPFCETRPGTLIDLVSAEPMFRCVGFVPRFLSAAAIVAIIATALRLIPHNLLKRLVWPVFSAYRSGCHKVLLSITSKVSKAGVPHKPSTPLSCHH